MSRRYLTLEEIYEIHRQQIEAYGGLEGVRDAAAIEAAVARPQSGYYETIQQEAAALWESLSQNHAFLDGNKRTALEATYTFLDLNGVEMTAEPDALFEFLDQSYREQTMEFERLEVWLNENTQERTQQQNTTRRLEAMKERNLSEKARAELEAMRERDRQNQERERDRGRER